jgi:isopenicillin-N N-acyltransferase-like protein
MKGALTMSTTQSFPLVEVDGDPFQRGRAHGAAVPERVARSVALYRQQLERRGVPAPRQRELASEMAPVIAGFEPAYLEEMRGIAAGAKLTLEDIILINCRTEMMFGHSEISKTRDALDDGCTGFIVLPHASASGRLIHAHNWDWREECIDTGIVLCMRRNDGPDLLTFTEAGSLARHGFNSAGVSLSGNFLTSDRDYQRPADVPLVLVRRKMLEASTIAAAMKAVWNTQRFCSNNLLLGQAGGEAVDLECAPDEIFWLQPENNILVHANHWLCPVARAKLKDYGLKSSPDSLYRQRRVTGALAAAMENGGKIDWQTVKKILADDYGKPDSVLRWPKPASHDSISATVATTLMDPEGRTMWIARKPYETREFVEYRL